MFEKLIPADKNLTIKDDTLFVGKVTADTANLLAMKMFGTGELLELKTYKDSFGTEYPNSYRIYYRKNLIFNLDRNYSFLDMSLVLNGMEYDGEGFVTVKADDEVVYTSKMMNWTTEPFRDQIAINKCKLLTITYERKNGGANYCIISDVIVYN